MNQSTWIARLKELHESRYSHHWALGDHVNFGITTWGSDACFEALRQLAGNSKGATRNFYRRCAVVAQLYTAKLRFPALNFSVYEALRHFPMSFLEQFIPEVAASGRSCKQILHLAIEQFGSNPAPHKKWLMRRQVYLKMSVYLAALERAKAEKMRTPSWIEQVIESALSASQNAGKASEGSSRNDVPAPADTQPRPEASAEEKRPSYAERRAAAKAASQQKRAERQAERLAAEQKKRLAKLKKLSTKKNLSKIKLQWTDCHGPSFVDGKQGLLPVAKSMRATCFATEAEATAANEQFQKYYGYKESVIFCASCEAFHLKHLFAVDAIAQARVVEIDLSVEQKEVRATVEDALQRHASQTSV